MELTIDLNADVGERTHSLRDGREEAIIRLISSANIACGGHAGDETTMRSVLELCKKHGVAVGAHPGYPDRTNFGRHEMPMSGEEIQTIVFEQVRTLGKKARMLGVELQHVKPHGALYNVAARDRSVAAALAQGVAQWNRHLILVGLAGSSMLDVWRDLGFRIVAEAFVDRRYESDGTLRSRNHADALITDAETACRQALGIIQAQRVVSAGGMIVPVQADTLCVHGDTPHVEEILLLLQRRLQEQQIAIRAVNARKME